MLGRTVGFLGWGIRLSCRVEKCHEFFGIFQVVEGLRERCFSFFDVLFCKCIEEAIFDHVGHFHWVVGNSTQIFELGFFHHGGVGNDVSSAVQSVEQFEFDAGGLESYECIDVGISHELKNFVGREVGPNLNVGVSLGCLLKKLRWVGSSHDAGLR